MANMSYCRFHNTNIDLADCLDALQEVGFDEDAELSESEFKSFKKMFQNFLSFCLAEGIIEDDEDELMGRLKEYFDEVHRLNSKYSENE